MHCQKQKEFLLRLALLFLTISISQLHLLAQSKEVWIAVNGPWAYVEDPDDSSRVVLIATQSEHHLDAQIEPAPKGRSPFLAKGQYKLEIANQAAKCDRQTPQGAEVHAMLFPLSGIDAKTISDVKSGHGNGNRYTISIPKPCYYSTLHSGYSIISPAAITASATDAEGKSYTNEMILHYFVTSIDRATLSSMPDSGQISTDLVDFMDNEIEFAMSTDTTPNKTDLECDSTSVSSFFDEAGLFTAQQFHAWFPQLNEGGYQKGNKGNYKDGCQDALQTKRDLQSEAAILPKIRSVESYLHQPKLELAKDTLKDLIEIQKAFNAFRTTPLQARDAALAELQMVRNSLELQAEMHIRRYSNSKIRSHKVDSIPSGLPKSLSYIHITSVGSADCHGAQINVNGVIPPPPTSVK